MTSGKLRKTIENKLTCQSLAEETDAARQALGGGLCMYAKLIEQPPCVRVAIIANAAAAAEGKIKVVANT